MQSSSPDASTSFATICFSRALSPAELNGMCTNLNFATRSAKSGTTYSFAEEPGPANGDEVEDCAAAAKCCFAASGQRVATAIAAPAARGSQERNVRGRRLVIGRQFYRGDGGLVNLEMQR